MQKTSAIVLAGGHSLRMGTNKASLKLDGKNTMVERVISAVQPITNEVLLVSDAEMALPPWVRHVKDAPLGHGCLRGLYSGLSAALGDYCLVVACDLPFLNRELLRYMLDYPHNHDALVPRLTHPQRGYELHPLHAVYSKRCLEAIVHTFTIGQDAIHDIYPHIKIHYLEEKEINTFDPQHLSFFNLNTPTDLARAREIMRSDLVHSNKLPALAIS